jgi:signal transduction histidine kinase
MRLSSKLAVLLTLFSFFSMVLVGIFAFESSRRALEKETINHLIATNRSKEVQINRWITDLSGDIEILAGTPFFAEAVAREMAANDVSGPVHRPMHRSLLEDFLDPVVAKSGFSEIFILEAGNGRVFMSTDSAQEHKFMKTRPFFVHGKTRTFVQNVFYSMSHQQATMTVSTPLKDRQGNVIAVLVGRFDLAVLSQIMVQRSPKKFTEDSYLVNTFNFYVTEPIFALNYALKRSIHTEGVIAGLNRQSGVGFYNNYRGAPVIGVYHWMPVHELCLITEIEHAEAIEPAAALRKFLIMSGVVLAFLAALVGGFSARSITLPLSRLVKETEKIGAGHLEYRIQTVARDEVGDLSRSFAQMVERLKETLVSRDRLAEEVKERERAEALLRDKHSEMEDFVYRVSHDLKSPMVTAGAFMEYLKKDIAARDFERAGKDMGYIQSAVEKMGQLLGELVELSRIGRLSRAPVAVPFQDLAAEALNLVAGRIAQQKVDVRVGDAEIVLHGDAPRLAEIWQNLVENAIKYMGDQTLPCIEIGAAQAWLFLSGTTAWASKRRISQKSSTFLKNWIPAARGRGWGWSW